MKRPAFGRMLILSAAVGLASACGAMPTAPTAVGDASNPIPSSTLQVGDQDFSIQRRGGHRSFRHGKGHRHGGIRHRGHRLGGLRHRGIRHGHRHGGFWGSYGYPWYGSYGYPYYGYSSYLYPYSYGYPWYGGWW